MLIIKIWITWQSCLIYYGSRNKSKLFTLGIKGDSTALSKDTIKYKHLYIVDQKHINNPFTFKEGGNLLKPSHAYFDFSMQII